jgi:N-acetylglucosamine-6-phosphate deacetylase
MALAAVPSPTLNLRGRHYATAEVVDVICGPRIEHVGPASDAVRPHLASEWVAPALFDLQINGCGGHSFNSPQLDTAAVRHVVDVCARHGVTGLCPTLVTAAEEALAHGCTTLRRAREQDPVVARAVAGLHLEGPYISPEDGPRGAHPRAHVRPPDRDEFGRLQDAAGGLIRLVTLAPEHAGALDFIEGLASQGVVVAIGHTAAGAGRIRDAVRAGARLSTHLGNGCHTLLPRHENYLWEQLACDDLWASVIADGHHLPAAVLRCILRVKTPNRTILTCDASSLAGLPAGRYREWGQELEVLPGGRVMVPGTGLLAGSGVFTDACVRHAVVAGGAGLVDAVEMASARPRQLLGLEPRPLATGAPADLVLLDATLAVVGTVVGGAVVRPTGGAKAGPVNGGAGPGASM